jgi:hypothetical protein
MRRCAVAGAATYPEMVARLGYESAYDLDVSLSVPLIVADRVSNYGWPFVDAEYKLGEVLVSSGVYDKLYAYYPYYYDYK